MMADKEFDFFVQCMGLKAMLLLIQTQGREITANGGDPDPQFLARVPRMMETLEGMVEYVGEGFDGRDIERGVVRLLARMAMEYGKGRTRK